jgi:PAS domain S-box-containing protein
MQARKDRVRDGLPTCLRWYEFLQGSLRTLTAMCTSPAELRSVVTRDRSGMKPDGIKKSGPMRTKVVLLDDLQRTFVLSPLRLIFTLALCIFIVEGVVNLVFEKLGITGREHTLLDSLFLTISLFIILYYRLFRPLVVLINDYKRKEIQLKDGKEHLEQKVRELSLSEAALQETKAILQAAMDQSPSGIVIADAPDCSLSYINNAGLLMHGAGRQTLVKGFGVDQYVVSWQLLDIDGHQLKSDELPLARAIRLGETGSSECIIRRPGNEDRIVLINTAPIRNVNDEIVAGIAVFWDITERKRTEEELQGYRSHLEEMVRERTQALEESSLLLVKENEETRKTKEELRESEERFRQLFEQSEDAIILISPENNKIIDLNPTAETIFRKRRGELLDGGLSALCDPEGQKQLVSILDQIIQGNSPSTIERFECLLPPGEVHFFSFHGKRIPLQGSEIFFTTFRDITTRIQMEEQAQEIQARLIQVNRMTSLGTMVSSVAHEINNPNNFLLMNAGIIKRAWYDIAAVVEEYFQSKGDFAVAQSTWSEARTFLPDAFEGIQQGALRISDIVSNLKEYGRDARFESESVADVNAVVQLSVAILGHLITNSTHRFKLDLVDDLPMARGSARQLEQVVINLIQNALQALPGPERAVLVGTGLDPDSGHVLIRVSDEGSGIPPEIAARIMEPFFTTRLERGGTGLGLAICSTIVKEHGGSIEFSSLPGKGTTFTVRLCRAESSKKTH